MGQATAYGQRHGKFLHLPDAPRSLITRSLRGIELAATETRHDDPVPGLSGQFPSEDAYLVSFKLRDYPDCECWERGRCVTKTDVRAGATYLYDLKRDPSETINIAADQKQTVEGSWRTSMAEALQVIGGSGAPETACCEAACCDADWVSIYARRLPCAARSRD